METSLKKIIIAIAVTLLVVYSAFIVWFSVQVFKQNKQVVINSQQAVGYINAGIATKLLPSVEEINAQLTKAE